MLTTIRMYYRTKAPVSIVILMGAAMGFRCQYLPNTPIKADSVEAISAMFLSWFFRSCQHASMRQLPTIGYRRHPNNKLRTSQFDQPELTFHASALPSGSTLQTFPASNILFTTSFVQVGDTGSCANCSTQQMSWCEMVTSVQPATVVWARVWFKMTCLCCSQLGRSTVAGCQFTPSCDSMRSTIPLLSLDMYLTGKDQSATTLVISIL